jgi:hypothetical protein
MYECVCVGGGYGRMVHAWCMYVCKYARVSVWIYECICVCIVGPVNQPGCIMLHVGNLAY